MPIRRASPAETGALRAGSAALGWSLFSFNVGVEVGQLAIVLVVASLLAALRRKSDVLGGRVAVAGSIVVIAAGSYWFVQRVFFPPI